jgi:hypothetical protein
MANYTKPFRIEDARQEILADWIAGRQLRIWRRWINLTSHTQVAGMQLLTQTRPMLLNCPNVRSSLRINAEGHQQRLVLATAAVIRDFVHYAQALGPTFISNEMDAEQRAAEEYHDIYLQHMAMFAAQHM